MPLILSLDTISEHNRDLVGNKAFALSRMDVHGMHVPDAICVSTQAYHRFTEVTGLRAHILMELKRKRFEDMRWEELWDTALRIRNHFLHAEIPREISAEMADHLQASFSEKPVCVRSSAPEEDAAGRSFAGLHESFVNITGVDSILKHIKLVWASLWSDAALLYRQELHLDAEQSSMAVIVQEMISGECSGVIFGSNPSNPSEAVIESVYGLNQGLVDGTVEPDRWILDRSTGTIRSRFSPERKKILAPSESGALLTALPSKLKDMPPLDDKRVKEVFHLAKKAEGLFGMPQDVEWTIREETLYVLQSRAITTLLNGQDDDTRPWYLSLRRSYENLKELSQRVEQKLIPSMLENAETMAEQDLSVLSDTALHDEIRGRAETARKWINTYRTDFIPLAHGIRLFGQMYNDIMNPSAPYEFMDLLANTEMKSLDRNRMLRHMAEQAASNPQFAADLKKGIIHDKEFRAMLDDYLKKFGDIYSDITHNTADKQSIIQTVLGMASQPLAEQKNRAHDSDQLEQGFFSHFTPDKRKFAEELLTLARTSYRLRDDDNIYLGKIKGQLFRAIEEMRARNRKDVQNNSGQDVPAEALEILEEQKGLKKTEDQSGLSVASGVQARQIVGQPSGPGISRGKARVIHDASDLHSLKAGEILVCDAIDPSMTFVVPLSAGIVERRGGMLIHGAIIAREYGLPCVTGVPDATQLIHTGDTVTVDGYLGLVIIDKG